MPNLRSIYKTERFGDLPLERTCTRCGETKPREQMIIQHRSEKNSKYYYFRPLCKDCHNARERGHRRDYKRNYLQKWRKQNASVNESYWKNDQVREAARVRAQNFTPEHKDAIAIQRRLHKRGESVTIAEARELLEKYGRCYPTRHGLTSLGLARCEQIRGRLRKKVEKTNATKQEWSRRRMMSLFEIRVMVYEESEEEPQYLIPPEKQPVPYQAAADNMRKYQQALRHPEVSL